METTRQTVFFSAVMDYQRAFWEWMGSFFAGGQISSNVVDRESFHCTVNDTHCNC